MGSAILFSKVDAAAGRFPEFVSEFRSFFEQQGLPVGTAEALRPLVERLETDSAFRDDLGSMLNVLCRHEQGISYLEMFGLLLVAAAGQDSADELPFLTALEEPVQKLFQFVVEARQPTPEDHQPATPPQEADDVPGQAEEFEAAWSSGASTPEPLPEVLGGAKRGSVLARALAISADEESFAYSAPMLRDSSAMQAERPGQSGTSASSTVAAAAQPGPAVAPQSGSAIARQPQWMWAVGGVVLGLLIGLVLSQVLGQVVSEVWPWRAGVQTAAQGPDGAASRQRAGTSLRGHGAMAPIRREAPPGTTRGGAFDAAEEKHARTVVSRIGDAEVPVSSRSGRGTERDAAGAPSAHEVATSPTSSPRNRSSSDLSNVGLGRGPTIGRVRSVDLNAPSQPGSLSGARGARPRLPPVVTGTSGIMAANVISAPAPAYPEQASAARVQGEVVIEAVVGRDGNVVDTRVVSGPELLREAAVQAVERWQFRPYEVDGTPAEIATTARLQFRLSPE